MPAYDKLLVLDMDETLVHADERLEHYEFEVGPYRVQPRPFVGRFLDFAFTHFAGVAVWTAASRSFAEPILDNLLDRNRLAFLWCYDRCGRWWNPESGDLVTQKNLSKLSKRGHDVRKVLCIDDTPVVWRRSYGNLVAVRPFFGDLADDELLHLEQYLHELGPVENVRTIDKRRWRSRPTIDAKSGTAPPSP